ncbi:hypothetical protein JCM10212_006252 [Sporobolomyces blumeae]
MSDSPAAPRTASTPSDQRVSSRSSLPVESSVSTLRDRARAFLEKIKVPRVETTTRGHDVAGGSAGDGEAVGQQPDARGTVDDRGQENGLAQKVVESKVKEERGAAKDGGLGLPDRRGASFWSVRCHGYFSDAPAVEGATKQAADTHQGGEEDPSKADGTTLEATPAVPAPDRPIATTIGDAGFGLEDAANEAVKDPDVHDAAPPSTSPFPPIAHGSPLDCRFSTADPLLSNSILLSPFALARADAFAPSLNPFGTPSHWSPAPPSPPSRPVKIVSPGTSAITSSAIPADDSTSSNSAASVAARRSRFSFGGQGARPTSSSFAPSLPNPLLCQNSKGDVKAPLQMDGAATDPKTGKDENEKVALTGQGAVVETGLASDKEEIASNGIGSEAVVGEGGGQNEEEISTAFASVQRSTPLPSLDVSSAAFPAFFPSISSSGQEVVLASPPVPSRACALLDVSTATSLDDRGSAMVLRLLESTLRENERLRRKFDVGSIHAGLDKATETASESASDEGQANGNVDQSVSSARSEAIAAIVDLEDRLATSQRETVKLRDELVSVYDDFNELSDAASILREAIDAGREEREEEKEETAARYRTLREEAIAAAEEVKAELERSRQEAMTTKEELAEAKNAVPALRSELEVAKRTIESQTAELSTLYKTKQQLVNTQRALDEATSAKRSTTDRLARLEGEKERWAVQRESYARQVKEETRDKMAAVSKARQAEQLLRKLQTKDRQDKNEREMADHRVQAKIARFEKEVEQLRSANENLQVRCDATEQERNEATTLLARLVQAEETTIEAND